MDESLFDLTGRAALVTGSSRGLGLAIAIGLARAGAAVTLNGRDSARLDQAVGELRGSGLDVRGLAFDVSDADQVGRAARQIADAGGIDILVNNAGMHRRGRLEEISEADWRAVINVNLTAAFLVAKAFVGQMLSRGSGKIINMCSLMSDRARPTTGPYAAAKGGLKMLTKSMAVEWASKNIQVNGIAPGYFATDLTRPLLDDAEFDAWVKSRTPAGRWGQPADLIGPAVFLAGRASDFVNGQILYVDGGMMASL